jgi:rhamnosyltransferase
MDDDSLASKKMVAAQLNGYKKHPEKEKIAIIAADILDINTKHEQPFITHFGPFGFTRRYAKNPYLSGVLCAIASGSLIKREALEALGAFREDFFIDYVDTEFCMRAIDQGWQIIAVKDAVLHHELGAKTQHSFGVITSNHAPMRRYTIYRNRIRMWKAYCFKVPGYVSYDILASGYDVLRILCFEHQKRQKLSSILRGIKEGISNKPLKRPS